MHTGLFSSCFFHLIFMVERSYGSPSHLGQSSFPPVLDQSGNDICALDPPIGSLQVSSLEVCAWNCIIYPLCENFNYNGSAQGCDLYFDKPTYFVSQPNCSHYQLLRGSPRTCTDLQLLGFNRSGLYVIFPGADPQEKLTVYCNSDYKVLPNDCYDLQLRGFSRSGVYLIYPGMAPRTVYCDMDTEGGGWTVIQRREDGSGNFYRPWNDYKNGFGNISGEYWIGNEALHFITSTRHVRLHIDLQDFSLEKRFAEYSTFTIDAEANKYKLTIYGYLGNAGDGLAYQNMMMFTTYDSDNDLYSGNCAINFHGAWWYNACHSSNLNGFYYPTSNGLYGYGITWDSWHGQEYSLNFTEMKIRPVVEMILK